MDDNAPGSRTARVKVSCIIPTLNRSDVLLHTIEQLFAQTEVPEIIVVDQTLELDPSTKSTLSAWSGAGRIRWIHQSDPNASKARNAGAIAAIGDVLLFLDDDIEVEPGFVAAHAANYRDSAVVAVSGQVLETECVVTTILTANPNDPDIGWIRFPKNYGVRCATTWMASGNFSVRREIYINLGGMDENYKRGAFREETDFAMRFVRAGYRFQFDPTASITHLGVRSIAGGGARTWSNPFQWHHCIGDWYFNVRFATLRNATSLIWYGFRHLVASRYNLSRPWRLPIVFVCWVTSLPLAVILRIKGPRLVRG